MVFCSNCGKNIHKCHGCENEFEIEEDIFCFNENEHFHNEDCVWEYLKSKNEIWESQTVEKEEDCD